MEKILAYTLRPIQEEDEELLLELYSSTRADEMALVPWDAAQKQAFLQMQFSAQHQYYQANYAGADFQIILVNNQQVGRLYVDRRVDEMRLIDIALLPEYRNGGIGSRLLKDLLAEAAQACKPVRVHVEKFNPALHLYERLGFSISDDRGIYWFMEWKPQEVNSAVPANQRAEG